MDAREVETQQFIHSKNSTERCVETFSSHVRAMMLFSDVLVTDVFGSEIDFPALFGPHE
jgi:hypothetical protein